MSYLLLQVVRLPDHVPSALHERNGAPAIRYPVSQANEAWEPNKYPHEREVIDPLFGGWRPGQDFPVDKIYFPLIKCFSNKSVQGFFSLKLQHFSTSLVPWSES